MKSSIVILIQPPAVSPVLPCWDAAVVAGSLLGSGLTPVYYDANLEYHRAHLAFNGEKFYDPRYFIALKNKITTCRADLNGEDGQVDPFVLLCEKDIEKEVNHHDPGMVIFFVSSPDQALAAQTMAGFIKARYPEILVVAMAKISLDLLDAGCFDHRILNQGSKGLDAVADLFKKVHGPAIALQTILPDFGGMPLGTYLTPEKMLLVYPLFFKDPVLLSDFLEDQVRFLGVNGFVFARDASCLSSAAGMCQHLDHWLSIKQPSVFFSMRVPAGPMSAADENKFSHLFSSGLRLIHWEKANAGISEKILWEASKQGIWNHLTGPHLFRDNPGEVKFIANNPNIVHSFRDTAKDMRDAQAVAVPEEAVDYAKVVPLPGIPFWKVLGDVPWLLLYVNQLTKKSVTRLRADLSCGSVITLGSQMTFFYQSPKDLPPGVLDEICKMVDAGGSVDITHVRSNLERAYLIGYAMENNVIIGNSSLKHPREEFILRLKQTTGVDFAHFVERGYTSVRPEYRAMGVGAKLLEGLTQRAKDYKVFSIISEDNLATQKIAIRNKTRKILTYFSDKLNKEMGVWMPEHMIDPQGDKEK